MYFLPLKRINSFHQVNELQKLTNSVRHTAVLLICSWWNRKVFLRDWKKTYTLHGNNRRLISEMEIISLKVSAVFPAPSPAFGKCGWCKEKSRCRKQWVCLKSPPQEWNMVSWLHCKGIGWSGRYTHYSDCITACNWGAGDSQESEAGLANSNHNQHLCVLLIKNRHKMNS